MPMLNQVSDCVSQAGGNEIRSVAEEDRSFVVRLRISPSLLAISLDAINHHTGSKYHFSNDSNGIGNCCGLKPRS